MRYDIGASAIKKLDRAEFHLKQLKRQVDGPRREAGEIAYRLDHESNELVVFTRPDTISLPWAVRAGEIVHQSRSALDHVVWDLIIDNGGKPKEGYTGFPVCWEKAKYETKVGMIDGINYRARTIIDGLQPIRPDYESDPLYLLNEMWNRDKHRVLNIGVYAVHALQVSFLFSDGDVRNVMVNIPDRPLPESTEIERRKLPFQLTPEVKMRGLVVTTHRFVGGPADQLPFLQTLSKLHEFSKSVTEELLATRN